MRPFPIPVVRAEDAIPHGPYCYTPAGEAPSAENGWVYRVNPCRYLRVLDGHPSQMNGWCDYLNTGDMMEGGTDLLWDSVKECGLKSDEPFDQVGM